MAKTSLTTKTGKTLLGPLNIAQLTELLEKANRKKEKAKILNRIRILKARKGCVEVVSSKEVVESASI